MIRDTSICNRPIHGNMKCIRYELSPFRFADGNKFICMRFLITIEIQSGDQTQSVTRWLHHSEFIWFDDAIINWRACSLSVLVFGAVVLSSSVYYYFFSNVTALCEFPFCIVFPADFSINEHFECSSIHSWTKNHNFWEENSFFFGKPSLMDHHNCISCRIIPPPPSSIDSKFILCVLFSLKIPIRDTEEEKNKFMPWRLNQPKPLFVENECFNQNSSIKILLIKQTMAHFVRRWKEAHERSRKHFSS